MPEKSLDKSPGAAAEAFKAVVERIGAARTILLVAHSRPDGDSLGSMSALATAANAAGKTVRTLLPDRLPQRYEHLFPGDRPAPPERFDELAGAAEAIVILDTRAFSQLGCLEAQLRAAAEKVVVIDHHATGDDFAAVQWVDVSAAAAGVMVGELIEALGWPVEPAVDALMTAVLTDTGWLRFANTDARCLRAVAGWLERGARMDTLYRRLFQDDRPRRLRLMARMLEGLQWHCDGRLAVMAIRQSDFAATGTSPVETENLINEAMRVGETEIAVLLVEEKDCVRASLRSRNLVDVAALAGRFGGGGHARAAGLRCGKNIDTLRDELIAACSETLNKTLRENHT
ncbi:MAG: DHH family phosphoesterase [Planctomycetota bacterium]|nr:DHH family phosphoesterase [Planctomycetota bacterium]